MGIFPKFGRNRKSSGYTYGDVVEEVCQPINPAWAAWYLRPGGSEMVHELISDFFDKYGTTSKLEDITSSINRQLGSDSRKYRANCQVIQRFSARALRGFYSTGLSKRGNHAGGLAFRPTSRNSELDRATDWVVSASTTVNGSAADTKVWKDIRFAIEDVVAHRDLVSIETLDYLHRAVGYTAVDARPTAPATEFYGSSAMGTYLLGDVYDIARTIRAQVVGGANPRGATDFAVFLMLGGIRAHPFGDGNGRSCRALYAATQIKLGEYFIPMARDWCQNQLHEVNIDAVVSPTVPDFLPAASAPMARRQRRAPGSSLIVVPTVKPVAQPPQVDSRGRPLLEIGDPVLM